MKTIKTIYFTALLMVGLLTLNSCGDDDDSSGLELTPTELAGTYFLTLAESTTITEQVFDAGIVTSTIETTGDTFDQSNYTFSTDGTYTQDWRYRVTQTSSATIEDQETEESIFITTINDSGTYSTSDVNSTITIDGNIYDVTRFNNSELRLELNETFTDAITTQTFNEVLHFNRQ